MRATDPAVTFFIIVVIGLVAGVIAVGLGAVVVLWLWRMVR